MNEKMGKDIRYLVNHIGSDTFVDYFEFFAKNVNTKNNKVIIDEFKKRGEDWGERMLNTKSTNWKRIFKEKREIEALNFIANNEKLDKKSYKKPDNKIRKKARELLRKLESVAPDEITLIPDEISEKEAKTLTEGAKQTITVNAYERNVAARQQCVEYYGYTCCVCDFNFEDMYGDIGKEYIHVHHIKPLSEIKKEYDIEPINDLRPVCPNCHAMIHRANISIEDLKKTLNTPKC